MRDQGWGLVNINLEWMGHEQLGDRNGKKTEIKNKSTQYAPSAEFPCL